jgi:ribosomal protein S18 acetylase RimI-like enzyme
LLRGHGLARLMIRRVEDRARALGYQVLNLDVRETQEAAIHLYETLGFQRWGVHPAYARVGGRTVRGFFYTKLLQDAARTKVAPLAPPEPPGDAGATDSGE